MALGDYIINDIKIINQKKNNDKLNRAIQAFLFTIVTEEVGALCSICMVLCMYTDSIRYLKLFCTLLFSYSSFLGLGYLRYNFLLQKVSVTAKKSVQILAELYRKKIWTDARTVNVLVCAPVYGYISFSKMKFDIQIHSKI